MFSSQLNQVLAHVSGTILIAPERVASSTGFTSARTAGELANSATAGTADNILPDFPHIAQPGHRIQPAAPDDSNLRLRQTTSL